MAIKDENDLIANGIISVSLISEGGSNPRLLIHLKNGEVLSQTVPHIPTSDDFDNLIEKILDRRKRREKLEKIMNKMYEK